MNKFVTNRSAPKPSWIGITTIAVCLLAMAGCFERVYYQEDSDAQEESAPSPKTEAIESTVREAPAPLVADPEKSEAFADQLEAELEADEPPPAETPPAELPQTETPPDETLADDLFGPSPPAEEPAANESEAPIASLPAEEEPAEVAAVDDEPQDEPSPSFEELFGTPSEKPADSLAAPPPAGETETPEVEAEPPKSTEVTLPDDSSTEPNTRLDAWLLGSKLSLAILAKQRGAPDEATNRWLAESDSLAKRLGLPQNLLVDALKMPTVDNNSRVELNHLLAVGKDVGARIAALHDAEHAALFETALKSNLFLVLYGPDEPLVSDISQAVVASAERAKLPANLWQPPLANLASQADFNEVKRMLYEFHQQVAKFLAENPAP